VVTFSAVGEPIGGNYEYRFWLKSGGVWSVVKDYSTVSTWTWDTTGVTLGQYWIQVDVRRVGSSVRYDTAKVLTYGLGESTTATGVTLTASAEGPNVPGSVVTFSAVGEPIGGNYEYRFWLKSGGVWSVVKNYSTVSTWTWDTTGAAPGQYYVQVAVRGKGSVVKWNAVTVLGHKLFESP
jgi:hypothetical protein